MIKFLQCCEYLHKIKVELEEEAINESPGIVKDSDLEEEFNVIIQNFDDRNNEDISEQIEDFRRSQQLEKVEATDLSNTEKNPVLMNIDFRTKTNWELANWDNEFSVDPELATETFKSFMNQKCKYYNNAHEVYYKKCIRQQIDDFYKRDKNPKEIGNEGEKLFKWVSLH